MKRVGERQRWVWLAGGLSAAVTVRACGYSWTWVLAGGALAVLYYIYMEYRLRPCGLGVLLPAVFGPLGKWVAGLSYLWMVLCLGWCACLADGAFPLDDGYPILGWILLAVAAWGCRRGPAPCARCAGVVFLFLTAVYALVGAFALGDVEPAYLTPQGTWWDGLRALGLFLLPMGVWYVPGRRRKGISWALALSLPLAAAALVFVTTGVLGPDLAKAQPAPFYALARSVRLFGVLERVEPLVSAAMTMGVFCLLSSLACGAQALGRGMGLANWTGPAACILAAGAMWPAGKLGVGEVTMGALVFWVAVPVLAVEVERRQSHK